GRAAAGEPEGAGRAGTAAEGHLARGEQGADGGPVRLAAGLAGPGLGDGPVRRGRADLAAGRGAGRRQAQVRLLEPCGEYRPAAGGAAVAEPLAGGAGLPADEGGAGAGPLRGPLVARVPPPRQPGDARLRVPGAGAIASEAAGEGPR